MINPLEKIRRTASYYYYKRKNNWFFPSNMAHITGGEIAKGNYEPEIRRVFEESLKAGDIFIDVGANVGYFTRLASSLVEDTGRVYSFEAEPFNYFALCKNTVTRKNVVSLNFAVSDCHRFIDFFKSTHSSSHSIYDSSKNLDGSRFSVLSVTLDNFWTNYLEQREISLVKIDVEGAEALVLTGMERMLSAHKVNAIILEFHPVILSKAKVDCQKIYFTIDEYFNIWIVRGDSRIREELRTFDQFKRVSNDILENGKKDKLNFYCKRKDKF